MNLVASKIQFRKPFVKIVIFILLIFFSLHVFYIYCNLISLKINKIHQSELLKNSTRTTNSFDTLILSQKQYTQSDLENNKEFLYKGLFYDVSSIQKKDSIYIIIAIADPIENIIIQRLNAFFCNDNNFDQKLIVTFLFFYYQSNVFQQHQNPQFSILEKKLLKFNIIFISYSPLDPPPKFRV